MSIENLSRLISEPSGVVVNVGPVQWNDEEAWHYYPCTFKVVDPANSRSGFYIEWDVPVEGGCVHRGLPYRKAEIFSMVDGRPSEITGYLTDQADEAVLLNLVQSQLDNKAEAVLNHSHRGSQPSLVTLNPHQARRVINAIEHKISEGDDLQIFIADEKLDTFEFRSYRACRVVVQTGTAEPSGLLYPFKKPQPNGFVMNMDVVTKDGVSDLEASEDAYFTLSMLSSGKDSCRIVLPDRSELRDVVLPMLQKMIDGPEADAKHSLRTSTRLM